MLRNELIDTLLENATSFSERSEITSLTEAETYKVSNIMVANLYQSVLDKSYIDFDDIPRSKGDITHYSGYKNMISSISTIKDIATKSNKKIPELDIVDQAISNLVAYKETFEKGFKLNKDFIVLQYNTLVAGCVNATTKIIYSYMDYVRTVDSIEIVVKEDTLNDGKFAIDALDRFNKLVSNGEFAKTMNFIIKNKPNVNESYLLEGIAIAAIPAIIVVSVVSLVKILRLLIFTFYNKKEELSRYLEMQAMFLELNKETINASNNRMDPNKKRQVLKKQERIIKKLRILADKLSVDDRLSAKKTVIDIKKEDSGIRISDVKTQAAQADSGLELQIL